MLNRLTFWTVLLTFGASAAAAEKYTVLVQDYASFPPYSAYEDGEYSGFNRELLDMFAEHADIELEYVALPVKRLFIEFVEGAGDLKYPDNPNWAMSVKGDTKIAYSDAVVEYVNGVMVRPEDMGMSPDNISTLGMLAGWTPIGYQDLISNGQISLLENNSYEGLLRQAILGRVSAAYSNISTSQYYLDQVIDQPDGLIFDEALPHVRSTRVLSSINNPELIERFDLFLTERAADISALKQEYGVERGIPGAQ